ncbi:hypothetical protein FIV07_28105 (plasmid) [Mycobacterium sp. THAF192]|nr:hypothetical protein FIV07_28105 [Mycobacterium sp. THAF192]
MSSFLHPARRCGALECESMNPQQWHPQDRSYASSGAQATPPLGTFAGAEVFGPPAQPLPGSYRMLYVEAQNGFGPPPAWMYPGQPAQGGEAPVAPAEGEPKQGVMSLRTAGFIFGILLGIFLFAVVL